MGRIAAAAAYASSSYAAGRLRFYAVLGAWVAIGAGFAATAIYAAVAGTTREDVGAAVAGCFGALFTFGTAVWLIRSWSGRKPERFVEPAPGRPLSRFDIAFGALVMAAGAWQLGFGSTDFGVRLVLIAVAYVVAEAASAADFRKRRSAETTDRSGGGDPSCDEAEDRSVG